MKLRRLHIRGFRSFDPDEGQTLELRDVNILLGANGSGKSNILAALDMIRHVAEKRLRNYILVNGADNIVYYGINNTRAINIIADFDDDVASRYEIRIPFDDGNHAAVERELVVEKAEARKGTSSPRKSIPGTAESGVHVLEGDGNGESRLADEGGEAARRIHGFLSGIRSYHFGDTSASSSIRGPVHVDEGGELHGDAGNLAAFLRAMKESPRHLRYYERIVRHVQAVLPRFQDFDLQPADPAGIHVRLNWRDAQRPGYLFGPHHLSDGSLRFIALAALLLQPPELMPSVIALDEPETGLHPRAIMELAGMVSMAAEFAQVLMTTQSTLLLDEFTHDDVIIVDRDRLWGEGPMRTALRRLGREEMEEWLGRRSLSELWEMDVIGGYR